MNKWTLLQSNTVIENQWIRLDRNRYRVADDREIDDYYVLHRSRFVLVVATEADRIVLVRQYRPATDKFYWSLPAGYLDAGERPEQAAARELLEETGLRSARMEIAGRLDPLPGYLNSQAIVVHARDVSGTMAVRDTQEIDEVRWRDRAEVLEEIRSGKIDEMQAVAAILLVLACPAS